MMVTKVTALMMWGTVVALFAAVSALPFDGSSNGDGSGEDGDGGHKGGRKLYYGAYTDSDDAMRTLQDRLGHQPAMRLEFVALHSGGFDDEWFPLGYLNKVRDEMPGTVPVLTIEPFVDDLDSISYDTYYKIASQFAQFPDTHIVRFGHECNGNWYPWTNDNEKYKKHFNIFGKALRDMNAKTKMMWAPNIEYPGIKYTYDQVYPGDDYVDIVGLSIYHKYYGPDPNYEGDYHVGPSQGTFADQITGKAEEMQGQGTNFYEIYSKNKNLPFMVAETAASTFYGLSEEEERAWKLDWLNQLFSKETLDQFPNFRGVNRFDVNKDDEDSSDQMHHGLFNRDNLYTSFRDFFNSVDIVRYAPAVQSNGLDLSVQS